MSVLIDGINYELDQAEQTAEVCHLPNDDRYSGEVVIPSTISYNGIHYSVTSIKNFAFVKYTGLTSITIPNSVESIGNYAFGFCKGLTSVTIPNSVESIGARAFDYAGLTSIVVERDNTVYDSRNNCNAVIATKTNTLVLGCQKTIIPDSVENIGNFAFSGCTGLTSITIPDSVTSIGLYAFFQCTGLTSIIIPDSVTSIGGEAFSGCKGLTSIVVKRDNTVYDSRNNCNAIIEKKTNTLVLGCQKTIIPDSVENIGNYAFSGCTGLTSVTIPNSVESIGERAFYGCINLTSIIIPDSVTSIGGKAFSGCTGLTSITIPNSVESIKNWAFRGCTGLTSITLPKSLSEIGKGVFNGCENLQTIRVPKGMTETYCKMGLEPWRDKMVEPQQEEYTILLNIARGYELGIGMARNLAQAVLCYVQAADKGCAEAAYHLGELYEEGKGLPQDYQQAADWFAKSSQLHHPHGETRRQACLRIIEEKNARLAAFQEEQDAACQAQQVKLQATTINKPQKTILFFDTDTNGLPQNYKGISATANWPRLIQLGWIISDESGNILKCKSQLIYPQSFTIAADVTRLTGITTEMAQRNGISLTDILQEFMADVETATLLVGHNIDIDRHIIGCELYRNSLDYRTLMDKPSVCTMVRSTDFCALPSTSRYHSGYKYPTLTELYTKLFGHTFTGAHDALSDITATKDCYFELLRRGIL